MLSAVSESWDCLFATAEATLTSTRKRFKPIRGLGDRAMIMKCLQEVQAIPGCELAVVKEYGHVVEFEKANELFGIVNPFIGQLSH